MNLNKELVFIPVADIEFYSDWDEMSGYGGADQIFMDDGIIVKRDDEDTYREHIKLAMEELAEFDD